MFVAEPITGTLGAEVSGINLAEDLDDETIAKLDATLAEHKVLCFRDQHDLGPDEQVRLGRRFGKLMVHPFEPSVSGLPELTVLSSEDWEPDSVYESWHSDMTCLVAPSRASMLRAVEVPQYGRDTMWADMEAAYEGLSSTMQRMLEGLTAEHTYVNAFAPQIAKMGETIESVRQRIPVPVHPVVRVHPVTGRRVIYVNRCFTTKIIGMRSDESNMLLRFLWDQAHTPEYQVRIRWQPGSVVMWDNRSNQHYIIFDRSAGTRRIMNRITIEEDMPV